MRNKRLLIIGGSAAIALFVVTFGTIWGFNHFNHHLRLSVLEGSHVEVYQGKKGWPDPFGQQQYAYETLLSERDMEVDKRFNEQGILDYGDLTNELTGYRPFAERIHGYIEHGNFSEVVKLKNKAFKDTSSNPKISRDVIRGLFGLKTETGFDLIKRPAREDKPSSLSDTDLTLLQENTLLFPLDELTPFPFFYNQLKQQGIGSVSASDPRIIDKLTHYLSDKNTNVRQYAAFALGQIGDPSAIPALANALKDKDENESMRSSAASALGNIGDTSASTALANALNNKDENEDVRSSAASALGRIGDTSAISVLANALNNKDENEDVRSSAASALGNIGDTSAISALANALKNENESVRSSAASALGNIGDPSAISVLANALNNKDENEDVRRAAASALGNIGDTSASSALANVFKDKDENEGVRSSAASALGNIGDTSTIPALAAALKNKDENESVRSSAASALGLIGDTSASTALANALKDENESVRSYAASALGLIGTPSASSALANALKDENESVRRDAASALGLIGDPSAISALANALKDESESVRRYAAEALGKIGSPHQIQVDEITQKKVHSNGDFFPGGYGEERKLSEIMGSVNDRRALLQALNLPVSPERNQQLLTLAQKQMPIFPSDKKP
ncbi:MAG: HEAT repeat domain-containing protein [Candidatus Thiothrix singaporensis]|uniref:HEAT repeat domain-containing protein n=1 Tax=Candidatus Thiothrix singaporensis TaxID=2799669 RepID=A0A7L6AVI6_9GAMM|nr:MAG: HEAT repeat domain-containing protein [Candidatus Thiothrix singaporensis]